MTKLKTLRELWEQNGCKPFVAISNSGERFHCTGIAPSDFAVGWDSHSFVNVNVGHSADALLWSLHKPEPKLVPHWPAITTTASEDGRALTTTLYVSEHHFERSYVGDREFIRLATELPPILLPEEK